MLVFLEKKNYIYIYIYIVMTKKISNTWNTDGSIRIQKDIKNKITFNTQSYSN
jgi:hypothetical protein